MDIKKQREIRSIIISIVISIGFIMEVWCFIFSGFYFLRNPWLCLGGLIFGIILAIAVGKEIEEYAIERYKEKVKGGKKQNGKTRIHDTR